MARPRRSLARGLVAALTLAVVACGDGVQTPAAPEDPHVASVRAAPASDIARTLGAAFKVDDSGIPSPACDFSQPPLMVNGIARYPSGQAQISTTASGRLRITNFGPSGQDGWCSALPGWNGELVTESPPFELANKEGIVFTWTDASGPIVQLALRDKAGGQMTGFMDYIDDACDVRVTWRRNGNVVQTEDMACQGKFKLKDMNLRCWSFHAPTGTVSLRGRDENANTWLITVAPTVALARGPLTGAAITVGTTVPGRTFLDGLGGGFDFQGGCNVGGE